MWHGALFWWRRTFFFICGNFWCFVPLNAPVRLYNIRYWCFFLSQCNRWKNTLRIPKYGSQNLVCWCLCLWSLWAAFISGYSLSWLLIWLRSEVVDLCFIYCHILTQTILLLRLNSCKQLSKSLRRCCFWSAMSKRGTFFELGFLIDRCSCKIVNTMPFNIFTPLLSHTTSIYDRPWWSFLFFSSTTADQKAMLYQHSKFKFFHCLENLQQ